MNYIEATKAVLGSMMLRAAFEFVIEMLDFELSGQLKPLATLSYLG